MSLSDVVSLKQGIIKTAKNKAKPPYTILLLFFFFLGGGKEGNASCTVAPLGAVCGTPVRLASGSILPLDKSAARPTH
jgi:hypothetical protein